MKINIKGYEFSIVENALEKVLSRGYIICSNVDCDSYENLDCRDCPFDEDEGELIKRIDIEDVELIK